MKNKLELISNGFLVYKIKQHIEYLHDQQRQHVNNKTGDEPDLSSLSFIHESNSNTSILESCHNTNNEKQNEEWEVTNYSSHCGWPCAMRYCGTNIIRGRLLKDF